MVSPLLVERRRHWRTSFGLIGAALAAGVAVSNERGVFVPIWGVDDAVAATARAFAAIAAPEPLQIDSLYTAPTTLRRIASTPQFRRIVDMPGMPAVAAPFTPADRVTGESPAATTETALVAPAGAAAAGAAPATLSFASLALPRSAVPGGGAIARPAATASPPATLDPTQPAQGPTPPAQDVAVEDPVLAVPEPASWAMMIAGFGLMGACQRAIARTRRRRLAA